MLSDIIVALCQAKSSVISKLADDPTASPTEICHVLFGGHRRSESATAGDDAVRTNVSAADLERARSCGQWGSTQPSELFLRAWYCALRCLEHDPLAGMVSPALMGSYGTIPLSIIAPLVDIVRHKANLIARAEREVVLVTCSWSPSVAVRLIHNALEELSGRAGRRGQRVAVKVLYDNVNPTHPLTARHHVKPDAYTSDKVGLPRPEQIPHLDFEVMTFHRLFLGTLHAKFCIVDRKIAVIESNNMEDNDNMEMMAHVEGPIVDSIYDSAIITWGEASKVPFLSSNTLTEQGEPSEPKLGQETLFTERGPAREQEQIAEDGKRTDLPEHTLDDPHYDADTGAEITRIQSVYAPKAGESSLQAVNRRLNATSLRSVEATGPEIAVGEDFTPYIPIDASKPSPIALVSRPPFGSPGNGNVLVPQNEAWLALIANAQSSIFIQTPDLNAVQLYAAITSALKRGVQVTYYVCLGYNDAGELMPGQGGTNEMFAIKLAGQLSPVERDRLTIGYYVGKDQDRPMHHSNRGRSCHVKLLIADGRIGIQGSGNQDTQSWCHSQELNLMVESEEVCRKWREGIERNQNTARYGIAGRDGVWRDSDGQEAPGTTGIPKLAPIGWLKGAFGMYKKAKESGRAHN